MSAMDINRLAKSTFVTITPNDLSSPKCGSIRFRWAMHVSLPFPLPSPNCVHRQETAQGRTFEFTIHNFMDRLIIAPKAGPSWPTVTLIARSAPTPKVAETQTVRREQLQSVASFFEIDEHATPNSAFLNAAEKVKACFEQLSTFLRDYQSAVPYLCSWQVYPISQFDVGSVHHEVRHLCPTTGRWDHVFSSITFNLARQLHKPLCHLPFQPDNSQPTSADLANELLAEAQLSLFRGMNRSAVINSFVAVESLANIVFKKKKLESLVTAGQSELDAEQAAESERKKHRTEISFLVHRGLNECCGRSYFFEMQTKYDELLKLQDARHKVAHAGHLPTKADAEAAHLLGCETVQWLCGVVGIPVRPLLPDAKDVVSGPSSGSQDIHAVSGIDVEFLRHVLGMKNGEGKKEEGKKVSRDLGIL